MSTGELFDERVLELAPGAALLRGFASEQGEALLREVGAITQAAPFRHLVTPGGYTMSVAMTNCGRVGWCSDRSGYRYDAIDPSSGQPWPAMPTVFSALAAQAASAAGFDGFMPDACLINRYEPGAKLSLHQDRDERDFEAPVVSLSLGDTCVFRIGGTTRKDATRTLHLASGDAVVLGGKARLAFHGVDRILAGTSTLLAEGGRINLTLRRVTMPGEDRIW